MILVVYSHICHFCLGDSTMAFNDVFFLFRLPCFFFISGWLFEPVAARPLRQVVGHKFMVQIVPTFIFLLLLAPPPEFFRQLGALKGGYWFTFVLFEFFLIYLFTVRCCRRGGWLLALTVTVAAFWFSSCQHQLRIVSGGYSLMPELLDAAGLLSMSMWRYYLFFYLGTWVRRHFQAFEKQASSPTVIFGLTVGFCVIASTAHPASHALEFLRFTIGGTVGMLMVFVWLFGRRALWMTFVPVILGAVFFIIKSLGFESTVHTVLCILLYAAVIALYSGTVFGLIQTKWILVVLFGLPFLYHIFIEDLPALGDTVNPVSFSGGMQEMSVLCIMLGLFCLSISMKKSMVEPIHLPRIMKPKESGKQKKPEVPAADQEDPVEEVTAAPPAEGQQEEPEAAENDDSVRN